MQKPTSTQRKLLREYKKTLCLSETLFEIGIGTLLGDASIQTQNGGKSFRLKYSQSEKKHREYLFHLHTLWQDWVLSPPFLNTKRSQLSFQTLSHPEFNTLAQLFVLDSQGNLCKKYIQPNFVENYVTPRALAYWLMDDGGKASYSKDYERRGLVLNTQGFSKDHVDILCQGLQKRYGFDCWLKPNKNGYIIVISGKNYGTIVTLLNPFLIDSMRYKFPRFELMT